MFDINVGPTFNFFVLEPVAIAIQNKVYSDNSLNTGGFWKTLIPNPVCKITSEIIVIFIIP